jgi:4'-phosphopantetheinyl transferase
VGEATAQVWWARRTDARPGLAEVLDDTERTRWTRYRKTEDQERFLVGCALAKTVAATCTGQSAADVRLDRTCTECGAPHGKPRVVGMDLELSVSHSGDLIAVAAAKGARLGVDVERDEGRRDSDGLARFILGEGERPQEAGAVEPRVFLRAWTRKEAVTKATGDGLRVPFTQVVVSGADEPPRVIAWPYQDSPDSVSLFDLDAPDGYLAALAVIGRCDRVDIRNGSALLSGVEASPGAGR